VLAFLGVVLHCEKGSAFDASAEGFLSVGAGGSDDFGIDTVGIVGVDEVKVGFSFEALPKGGIWFLQIDGIPSHMRDFDVVAGEAFDVTVEDAEAVSARTFLAALE